MQEIAQVESEEQQLRARPSKELTVIADSTIDTQEADFNDNDELSEDEPYSYRFSRRAEMKVKYGNLKPLFFHKNGSGPRVVLGPDCRLDSGRGLYCLPFFVHQRPVLRVHVRLWRELLSDREIRTHGGLCIAADDHGRDLLGRPWSGRHAAHRVRSPAEREPGEVKAD